MPVRKRQTQLQRTVSRMKAPREGAKYNRMISRAYKAASVAQGQGPSKGRITAPEKKAIARAARATRMITTPGEARGVKKILRRKARRS